MSYILVIVESPGKIKKIQSYLGDKYKVCASYGHIRELDTDKLDDMINNNFKPIYKNITKKNVIGELKKLYSNASDLLIASDLDREGEQIAESIAEVLKVKNAKRIVFTEITKTAISNAVSNYRDINKNMVDSQKTRCLLDLIVGYKLSPVLWKNISPGLSAGRVQSVVVKLIVDKENEIKNFKDNNYFNIYGNFIIPNNNDNNLLKTIMHNCDNIPSNNQPFKSNNKHLSDITIITNLLNTFDKSIFSVYTIFDKFNNRNPSPPFITSTLQQDAGRKFGFTPKRTMDLAQKLYEQGFITYMRTDSVTLSQDCINDCKKYITDKFGANYSNPKQFDNKSKNSQEAHEAIRPTLISRENVVGDADIVKLYSLIWKRTIASQMSAAKIKSSIVQISITFNDKLLDKFFEAKTDTTKFDGFLIVYNVSDDDEEKNDVNNVVVPKIGSKLNYHDIIAKEDYTRPPTRYNEANLIKKLEELGIGRPSTYASIMGKIQDRKYVEIRDVDGIKKKTRILKLMNHKINTENGEIIIGKDNKKLLPTDVGINITNYLLKHFSTILDYKFTANFEDYLDNIVDNKDTSYNVLFKFYSQFNPIIEKLSINKIEGILLGNHPEFNLPIYATNAKFGPVVKIIKTNEENKSQKAIKIASIEGYTLDNITLENAIELLKYPLELGNYENKPVVLYKGKFGFYIEYNNTQYNVNNENDSPIDFNTAVNIITNTVLGTHNDKPILILNGKYGKYIKYDNKNYAFADTLEKAIEIIDQQNNKNIKVLKTKSGKQIYNIINGQYGPCIMYKLTKVMNKSSNPYKYVKIPEDINPQDITIEQVEELIKNYKPAKFKNYKSNNKPSK